MCFLRQADLPSLKRSESALCSWADFTKEEDHVQEAICPEEIVRMLREAEILISQGKLVAQVIKSLLSTVLRP